MCVEFVCVKLRHLFSRREEEGKSNYKKNPCNVFSREGRISAANLQYDLQVSIGRFYLQFLPANVNFLLGHLKT